MIAGTHTTGSARRMWTDELEGAIAHQSMLADYLIGRVVGRAMCCDMISQTIGSTRSFLMINIVVESMLRQTTSERLYAALDLQRSEGSLSNTFLFTAPCRVTLR